MNLKYSPQSSPQELIKGINWQALRDQKQLLIEMDSKNKSEEVLILGLLTLLDKIQDCAVDYLGIPEEEVFNLTND